ncbi:MAG: transposase [Enterobacterales bacterium]|jgi:transposase
MLNVAESLHVSLSSLHKWIVQSRDQSLEPKTEIGSMSHSKEKRPQYWSTEEKFQIIFDCNGFNENEASAICREKYLHLHHLTQWKKEVHRKGKALAETAALLVL